MKNPTRQTDRHVEAVLAALDVLDCFLSTPSMTTKQLIDRTGFTRNRVMRLTGTLLHKGYLIQDEALGEYRPGPKIGLLNKGFEPRQGIALLARPILKQIAVKTGEFASMYVREGLERVILVREEGTQAVRYTVAEGQRLELYTGASGKVILAYAPKEVLETLLSSVSLVKRTQKTITDPAQLQRELERIRQQGYAESVGERVVDVGAVATPVFDSKGDLVGSLSITGPVSRFTPETRKVYIKIALAAAAKLSEQLGWRRERARKSGEPYRPLMGEE
jgi:DNA-binding IclR family transcriptional regulator